MNYNMESIVRFNAQTTGRDKLFRYFINSIDFIDCKSKPNLFQFMSIQLSSYLVTTRQIQI